MGIPTLANQVRAAREGIYIYMDDIPFASSLHTFLVITRTLVLRLPLRPSLTLFVSLFQIPIPLSRYFYYYTVDLESPLVYTDSGHTDPTAPPSPSDSSSCCVIRLPIRDRYTIGHETIVSITSIPKRMLIHTMPCVGSSLHTWDGYTLRNTPR